MMDRGFGELDGGEGNMNRIEVVRVQRKYVAGNIGYLPEGPSINERLKEQKEPSAKFTEDELIRVTGTAELKKYGDKPVLVGTLSNGCGKPITSVVFRVVAKNNIGTILWDRIYRIMISIESASSEAFKLTLRDIHDAASVFWMIEEVHG